MRSREIWAGALKNLRDKNEDMILACITNLVVTFTEEQITVNASNPTIMQLLTKHKHLFPDCVNIRLPHKSEHKQTTEEKLEKIFGKKLVLQK